MCWDLRISDATTGAHSSVVMAGLVPAIHVFLLGIGHQDVDAGDERGRGSVGVIHSLRSSDTPVISGGFGRSMSSSNVGARSARRPCVISARLRAPRRKSGT